MTSKVFETHVVTSSVIQIPENIATPFYDAGHKRVQLNVFFEEKQLSIHVALQKTKGLFIVYFGKRHWKTLGLVVGDAFQIELTEDTSQYGVVMPEALQEVLDTDPEATTIFSKLTDGKKRSIIYFIRRYKNTQTQVDKSLIITERLKMGITDLRALTRK